MQYLTRSHALELLPLIIDDEAGIEEKQAFLEYIESDDELRRQYESHRRIKHLLRQRTPKKRAPESLRQTIRQLLDKEDLLENDSYEFETEQGRFVKNDSDKTIDLEHDGKPGRQPEHNSRRNISIY